MRLLVTGCVGFIGWKVSEFATRQGHQVLGIDNLNNAYDQRLTQWRFSQVKGMPNFTFQPADIANRNEIDSILRSDRFDAVINLAARAGVRQSLSDPWIYYETNVEGTLNLLECCRTHGITKLVLASTSSLYAGAEQPFREDQSTDRPLSPYAASKKAAEALCYTYHALYGVNISVLRYFTVYGPAGRPDMSLFRFVQWISEERPVIVYGDGQQSRDFTYVDDIAVGTLASIPLKGYEIINLGSDHPVVLTDVIRLIEGVIGKKAAMEYHSRHPSDMEGTWADISKARKLLKWQPQTRIEEGVRRLCAWYREQRDWTRDVDTV